MPDATITSTASTFGTISGTFSSDQSTVTGTISGVVTGTLTGSVGVPGPQGPEGPEGPEGPPGPPGEGGTWGSIVGTLSNQTDLQTALNLKAPLASPALTGVPTAPTAATLTSTTQLATTAFVQQELAAGTAVAKNLEVYVRNQSGSTIAAGAIVYISGATGNRPLITLAQANNDANSAQTIGFVKASIANNGFGYVMVRGELENIDTSALTEGVQLYLSPTTAGAWTTTKPSAPQHLVYVGIVIRSHPTQGVILVAVQNGYELNELHDVAISSPTNGQVLKYDSATSLWKNATDSSGVAWGGITGTLSSQTDLQSALDAKQSVSGMSAYLTKAGNLSGLTDLTTARDNLNLGTLDTPVFAGVTAQGSGSNVAYLTPTSLTLTHATSGSFTIQPSAGITFPDGSTQTTAFTGSGAGYITSVSSPLSVTSGNLTIDLSAYLTSATAASTYQTQAGMSSYLTTSAAASTYAPLASAALTGNVTITTNSTSPALVITQDGTGDIIQFKDVTSDTTYSFIDQNGKVGTVAATTTAAGFNVPHGTAPTSPVNGDIWTTTGGIFWRQNGSTKQAMNLGDTQTVSGSITFSNASLTVGSSTAAGTINLGSGATISGSTKTINIGTAGVSGSTTAVNIGSSVSGATSSITLNGVAIASASTTARPSLRIPHGSAPTTPTNGDLWTETTGIFVRINGASQQLVPFTALSTYAALGSPAFTGVPTAPTATAGTNTTQIATTAFVQAAVSAGSGAVWGSITGTLSSQTDLQSALDAKLSTATAASTYAPLASPTFTGTVTIPAGASISGYATTASLSSYAPLASPALTGTPTAPTAAVDTNTTQVATTAYVVGQGYLKSATASSTYAPLASPALTGTPTAPTATAGTNTTQIATTAFVTAAVPAVATNAQSVAQTSSTTVITPANIPFALSNGLTTRLDYMNNTAVSGTGTITYSPLYREAYMAATGVAGRAAFYNGIVSVFYPTLSSNANELQLDFSKKIWMSGRFGTTPVAGFTGDANGRISITLGGFTAVGTGNMTSKGIGLIKTGGTSSLINLAVHNGTTYTTVATTKTLAYKEMCDYVIYSDGAGNVSLYINGVLEASTSSGPTGLTADGGGLYREQCEQTASSTVKYCLHSFGGQIITSR